MNRTDLLNGITTRAAKALPRCPPAHAADGSIQEQFNGTRKALRDVYPFLWFDHPKLSEEECAQYEGLFSWLVHALASYATHRSPCLPELLAMTSLMDCDGQLWHELCQAIGPPPPSLIEDLRSFIRTYRIDSEGLLARNRSEADQVYAILADAASRNWNRLHSWTLREAREFQVPLKQQAWAALARLDPPSLRAYFEEEHDFFEVNTYVLQAPTAESLRLAITTGNWTLRFWAVFHSAQRATAGANSFPAEWETLLTEAACMPEEWRRWLAVLNEYPGRYPQLQKALGTMLATVSDHAIDTYVASLSDYDANRLDVATTLHPFRIQATLQKRQRLWNAAHRRWLQWDFGRPEHSSYISDVRRSAFDFPAIGYIVECMDDAMRTNWRQELRQRAAAIESDWHADPRVPVSKRFELISAYQLLAHAEQVIAGATDWLPTMPLYCPDWENRTHYRALRYDGRFETSPFYVPEAAPEVQA